MAEGARLEIVCRGNSTVGSNPTLSAITLLPPRGLRRPAVRQAFYEGLGIEAFGPCLIGPWGREAIKKSCRDSSAREVEKFKYGEVPEWSNGAVSKTVDRSRGPWVRIPPSPPST